MSANANTICFGGPSQNVAQNAAATDGNNYAMAANTQTFFHGDALFNTAPFNYSMFYLYCPLGVPRFTNQPNTGINTQVPSLP